MWPLICLQLETCLSHQFLLGKRFLELAWGPPWALSQWQHTLWGNGWKYNGWNPRNSRQTFRRAHFPKCCREWDAPMWRSQFFGGVVLQLHHFRTYNFHTGRATPSNTVQKCWQTSPHRFGACPTPFCQSILAEGAIALSVTLSGGVLFASWNY